MRHEEAFWTLLIFLAACASPEERAAEKARAWVNNGENQKAAAFLEQVTEAYPKSLELKYLYGWAFLNVGDQRRALHQFARCLNADPKDYRGHKGLGEIFLQQGNLKKAQEEFDLALKARPDLPEIYASLATLRVNEGRASEARELFDKAISLEKKYADFRVLLARFLFHSQQPEEALKALDQTKGKPFLKKALAVEKDCIAGASRVKQIEKIIAPEGAPAAAPNAQQKKDLKKAKNLLLACQKKDRAGFQYHGEFSRVRVLLGEVN